MTRTNKPKSFNVRPSSDNILARILSFWRDTLCFGLDCLGAAVQMARFKGGLKAKVDSRFFFIMASHIKG